LAKKKERRRKIKRTAGTRGGVKKKASNRTGVDLRKGGGKKSRDHYVARFNWFNLKGGTGPAIIRSSERGVPEKTIVI